MDEIKKKLDDEIESGLNTLSTMSVDNDKYGDAADNVAKLYKLRLDEQKLNEEIAEKEARRELDSIQADRDYQIKIDQATEDCRYKAEELETERKKLRHERVAMIVGAALTAATFVGGLIFEGHWYKKGFEFENTGTYVGQTFKWFRGNHRPKIRK